MTLRAKDVAKLLGVSEGRVSQLRASGDLPSCDQAGIDALRRKREERQRYHDRQWERLLDRDAREDVYRDEILEVLRAINRNLMVISTSAVAGHVKVR